jgi:zinc transport system substrate-binding protein
MKKVLLTAVIAALLFTYPTALAQGKVVVTSFYPIYILTRNLTVGIDDIQVENLAAPNTGCLHDYQLLTGDMRTLSGAQVLLVNGAGMESYLDTVTAQFPNLVIVDASQNIPLLDSQGENEHTHAEGAAFDEHEDNAHIWLDAKNAMAMVENLRKGLQSAFPEYSDVLTQNAAAYIQRLKALDAELKAGLEGLPQKDIITFHEAFPYFANAYGLHVAAVVNREPGEALSPAQLAGLTELVRTLGVPSLFTEPQYPDLAARTLAAETGAKVYELDPLVTGPMDDKALTAYEDGMRKNMQVLIQALGDV